MRRRSVAAFSAEPIKRRLTHAHTCKRASAHTQAHAQTNAQPMEGVACTAHIAKQQRVRETKSAAMAHSLHCLHTALARGCFPRWIITFSGVCRVGRERVLKWLGCWLLLMVLGGRVVGWLVQYRPLIKIYDLYMVRALIMHT